MGVLVHDRRGRGDLVDPGGLHDPVVHGQAHHELAAAEVGSHSEGGDVPGPAGVDLRRAGRADFLGDSVGFGAGSAGVDRDFGAGSGQFQCDGAAEVFRRAGDQRDFAGEFCCCAHAHVRTPRPGKKEPQA